MLAKKKRALLTVAIACVSVIVFVFLIFIPLATVIVYESIFGVRFETAEWSAYSIEDFDGLALDRCNFKSDKGQMLTGYHYMKDRDARGVVVMAHGFGGGGHNQYMNIADYFASNGYFVFSYDVTGNDESEGYAVGGLPQGVIDLDYALRYVKSCDKYKDLPIVLFGHSWGGYSVGAVLKLHTDISAVISVSGFDCSSDMLEQEGRSYLGPLVSIGLPYVRLYDSIKFGEYATYSASDGFAASDAGVMVIHSRDDETVLTSYGYDKYYATYQTDSRFEFVEFDDRGHNYVLYSDESQDYRDEINRSYTAYVEANGGEYNAEIKTEFMDKYFDKSLCYDFDDELMSRIVEFYDKHC